MGGLSAGAGPWETIGVSNEFLKTSTPESCPLCGAGPSDQILITTHVFGGDKRSSAFFHCRSCDVRHQFPRLTALEEKKFYAEEFEAFMERRFGAAGGWQSAEAHVQANEPNRLRRMDYLRPLLVPRGRLLAFIPVRRELAAKQNQRSDKFPNRLKRWAARTAVIE